MELQFYLKCPPCVCGADEEGVRAATESKQAESLYSTAKASSAFLNYRNDAAVCAAWEDAASGSRTKNESQSAAVPTNVQVSYVWFGDAVSFADYSITVITNTKMKHYQRITSLFINRKASSKTWAIAWHL